MNAKGVSADVSVRGPAPGAGGPQASTGRLAEFKLYYRVLRQLSRHWVLFAGMFVISLLATPISLLQPLPLKIVVDSVLGSAPVPVFLNRLLPDAVTASAKSVLIFAVTLSVVVALLREFRNYGMWLVTTYTGQRMLIDFRAQLLRHAQRLSLAYHDAKGTADAIYRVQHDAPAITAIALDSTFPVITAAVTFMSMAYVCLRLDWQLALIGLTILPVFMVISEVARGRLRTQWKELKNLESSTLAVVQEVLGAARVVKAFGQEDREHHRYVNTSTEGMKKRLRVSLTESGFGILRRMLLAVATAAVLYVGVRHVQAGELSLGNFLLMMTYLAQLYAPIKTLGTMASSVQSHLASIERAFALLDEAPDVREHPHPKPLSQAAGAISFHHVTFGYEPRRPALRDVSFEIPAGIRLGIAGATGAGKTTVVNLVTRFFDPTEGAVHLDGVDLREYRIADLRNQFAIVLQDPLLFSTTIAENVAYGRPGASDEDIVAAAKAANAHEFIMNLPKQYQTQVGERGLRLSGGERQRLSLARAFLKDAPILILDEPTSSVDVRTEASIMEALQRLMSSRTTIMIAHRLSTLDYCDMLLVLEHGQVVALTTDIAYATRLASFERGEGVQIEVRR